MEQPHHTGGSQQIRMADLGYRRAADIRLCGPRTASSYWSRRRAGTAWSEEGAPALLEFAAQDSMPASRRCKPDPDVGVTVAAENQAVGTQNRSFSPR